MKKILVIILLNLVVALFTACQSTPDEEIITAKDNGALIEAAEQNNSVSTEPFSIEMLNIPDKLSLSIIEDNLHINVDADIHIPDVESFQIIRVEGTDFLQQQVTFLFNYFCSDSDMYIMQSEMTKQQVEEQIINLKARLQEAKNNDDEGDIQICEDQIAIYSEKLLTAPETFQKIISDGSLYLVDELHPNSDDIVGQYTGLFVTDGEKDFRVYNNSDRKEPITFVREGGGGGGRALKTNAKIKFKKHDDILSGSIYRIPIDENTTAEQQPYLSNLEITPFEAKQIVDDFLLNTNIPMVSKEIYLVKGSNFGFAYEVECARLVNGAPCAIVEGEASGGADKFSQNWAYERLKVLVTENGIHTFEWNSPLEIMNTVVENCNLLPFSDIQSILETMLPIVYEYEANQLQGYDTIINIDNIELTQVRVSEQNSITTGLLVPSWRFYGTKTINEQTTYGCWLTINAVDGSVINTDIGY